jgi:inner membrane protein
MDPLAHTLLGATLAESGLKRRTPLATAALLLGSNAPDIDIVAQLGGSDAALGFRRGHTHGVLAMLALPLLLTGALVVWDRTVRRRRHPEGAPVKPSQLLLLSLLATWTHPLLDWLNTYGVRLLMPFDGRWFYGDSLFIIDPWLWLLMAAAVVLARSHGKPAAGGFLLLALATSALILGVDMVPTAAKVGWGAGVLAIFGMRLRGSARARVSAVAKTCLAALALYTVAMVVGSRRAVADAHAWLAAQGIVAEELAADPQPGNPFAREVIALAGERYYFVERTWWGSPALRFSHAPIAVGPRDAPALAALALPELRGLRDWLRFPAVQVVESEPGYAVTIRDVRYARMEGARLGTKVVILDRELRLVRLAE